MYKEDFIGEVIDNNDPDKKGRIKVRVPSLHWGVGDEDLPFLYQDATFSSFIPEIGEKVYCYYTDAFKEIGFYTHKLTFENKGEFTRFEDEVKATVGSSAEYPNMKYQIFKNGTLIGVDSSDTNPEVVIFHPSGAYIFINKDGLFDIKSPDKSVKELFTDLFTKIAAIITVGSATTQALDPASQNEFLVNLPLELDKIFL